MAKITEIIDPESRGKPSVTFKQPTSWSEIINQLAKGATIFGSAFIFGGLFLLGKSFFYQTGDAEENNSFALTTVKDYPLITNSFMQQFEPVNYAVSLSAYNSSFVQPIMQEEKQLGEACFCMDFGSCIAFTNNTFLMNYAGKNQSSDPYVNIYLKNIDANGAALSLHQVSPDASYNQFKVVTKKLNDGTVIIWPNPDRMSFLIKVYDNQLNTIIDQSLMSGVYLELEYTLIFNDEIGIFDFAYQESGVYHKIKRLQIDFDNPSITTLLDYTSAVNWDSFQVRASNNKSLFIWSEYYGREAYHGWQVDENGNKEGNSFVVVEDITSLNEGIRTATDIVPLNNSESDYDFLFVFQKYGDQGYTYNLYSLLVSLDGRVSQPLIKINKDYSDENLAPKIGVLHNGCGFIVTYFISKDYVSKVCARRLDKNGINFIGEEFYLNNNQLFFNEAFLRIAVLQNNNFMNVFSCHNTTGGRSFLFTRSFHALPVPPSNPVNQVIINGKGLNLSDTVLTKEMLSFNDPDGPNADIVIMVSTIQNCWFTHGGATVTTFTMGDVTSGLIHIHTDSNAIPSFNVKACDVTDLCADVIPAQITYNNPDHVPELTEGKKIPDVLTDIGQEFALDVTDKFTDIDNDLLRYSFGLASEEPMQAWINFITNSTDGRLWVKGKPAPGAYTDTYTLKVTETTRVAEANATAKTSFRIVIGSDTGGNSNDGTPAWKVILPAVMTPLGLTGTFLLCTGSACLTLGGGTLCFVGRQQWSDKRAAHKARRENHFGWVVYKTIGYPREASNFKSTKGQLFLEALDNIFEELKRTKPTKLTEQKKIGKLLGESILEVENKHGYGRWIRRIIGFHFSLFCCGLIQPGSIGNFIEKHKEEIAEKFKEKLEKVNRGMKEPLLEEGVELEEGVVGVEEQTQENETTYAQLNRALSGEGEIGRKSSMQVTVPLEQLIKSGALEALQANRESRQSQSNPLGNNGVVELTEIPKSTMRK